MRNWMDLFESYEDDLAAHDAAEDDRLSQVYARERVVEQGAADICQRVGLTGLEGNRPIMFSEDDGVCVIKLNEAVTLAQLEGFRSMADEITVTGNSGFGVIVSLKVIRASEV